VGVDRTYISKWENGVVRPDWTHLVILWRILHGLRIEAGVAV
jgi:transcriptional regulator with XRE-family HTH domain